MRQRRRRDANSARGRDFLALSTLAAGRDSRGAFSLIRNAMRATLVISGRSYMYSHAHITYVECHHKNNVCNQFKQKLTFFGDNFLLIDCMYHFHLNS